MALDAGSVFAVLGGKFNPAGFAQFDAAMKKSTASATAAEKSHARSAGAMTMMGTAAKTGAAVGIAAVGYALVKSVQSAAKFETKMSELQAVTRANTATMKTMSKAALDLGAKTGVGATEAAGALTELAKGGLDANTSIAALSGTIALAQAGDMDLADAANTVVKSLSLFALKGADAGHVADGLASAANATSMDVKDFAQALAQGGSAAAAAGFSFDDTINVMASMANKFQSGSDLGTSLKTTLVQMANPSKKAAAEMDRLGISIFKANGEIKPVASIVSMLGNRFKGMSDKQKLSTAATIAGTDGMRTLLALLGGSGKDIIVPGSAADIAAKKMDNFNGAMKRLSSQAESLGIELGRSVVPALGDAANAMAKFAGQMRKGEGAGGVLMDILKGLGTVINFSLGGLAMAAFGVVDLFDKIAQAGALIGIPGFEDAHQKLQKLGDDLVGMSKSLMDVNKKPVNIKLIADKKAAISAIREIQNSKIAPKVAKVLGSTMDAHSKIKALMALKIPYKLAKTLTNAKDTQDAIKQLKAELASIRNPPAIVFTATEGGSQRAWNRLSPGLASGTSAGMAQTALVGEGGGPEWIVNRDTGTARKVTGPQVTNLSASEYVIPTESKYRPQALGLLGMLAADLGVSGFKRGLSPKQKRDRRYAAQDRRAQGYSDKASEQGTWMDTYQQRGDSGKWSEAKARQARYLGLERDYVANILKHPGRSKGARLQVMKSLRAQIANDIETNKAAEFSKAESSTYTKEDQDKLTGFAADLAKASFTPSTDDDLLALNAQNAYLTKLYNTQIVGGQRGNQAIIDVAGDLRSVRDQIAGLTTPGDSASSRMTASRNATSEYGSNFMAATPNAGAQIRITNHYQSPPEDPHSWSNGVKYELKAAL